MYLDKNNNFEIEFDWDLSKVKDNDKLNKLNIFARGLSAIQNGKMSDYIKKKLSEYATVSGKQNEGAVLLTSLDHYLKNDRVPAPQNDDEPIFSALEAFMIN